MTTPTHRSDDFEPLADGNEIEAALQPRRTVSLPAATAVLAGLVVLVIGLAGGAGLYAALGPGDDAAAANQPPGARGYGQFRPQGGGAQNATVGTVVSASASQLVVRTQNGDVTVKLTGETDIEITGKGTVADLRTGEQVIVSGSTTDGTLTAQTVRQGGTASPRPR